MERSAIRRLEEQESAMDAEARRTEKASPQRFPSPCQPSFDRGAEVSGAADHPFYACVDVAKAAEPDSALGSEPDVVAMSLIAGECC